MIELFKLVTVSLLLLTVPGLRLPLTFASSDFGNTGSASGPDYTPATCTVFTGPRDLSANGVALASDEFLLTINNGNGTELSLTGRFDNSYPADLKLLPNRAQAESSFAAILRAQANDPQIKFHLDGLSTDVQILPVVSGQIEVSCHVTSALPIRLSAQPSIDNSAEFQATRRSRTATY